MVLKISQRRRYAKRLPKGRKAKLPGELVQIDTLFVNVRPDKPIKHFTAYDPVAKWTFGRVAAQASAQSAKALLDKLVAEAPFVVRGIQVDGGSEFRSVFETKCQARGLELCVLPPNDPTSTDASSAPNRHGDTNSTLPTTCLTASKSCKPSSTPSPTASTTTGPTRPLATEPQQSICKPSASRPARLICCEPGPDLVLLARRRHTRSAAASDDRRPETLGLARAPDRFDRHFSFSPEPIGN